MYLASVWGYVCHNVGGFTVHFNFTSINLLCISCSLYCISSFSITHFYRTSAVFFHWLQCGSIFIYVMFWRKAFKFSQQWLWSVRSSGRNGVYFGKSTICFRGTYCLLCVFFLVCSLTYSSILKVMICSSEMSVNSCWTSRHYNPDHALWKLLNSLVARRKLDTSKMHNSQRWIFKFCSACDAILLLVDRSDVMFPGLVTTEKSATIE